jgi:hypothetical protein
MYLAQESDPRTQIRRCPADEDATLRWPPRDMVKRAYLCGPALDRDRGKTFIAPPERV